MREQKNLRKRKFINLHNLVQNQLVTYIDVVDHIAIIEDEKANNL